MMKKKEKEMFVVKNLLKSFAVIASCAVAFGTMGVASAGEYEYEGYDENGNYVYAVADEDGNVASVAVDENGNYAVYAEGEDGSTYEETGEYY